VAAEAVYGFAGVVLGSVTTSVLAIYNERRAASRERSQRDHQYERDRKMAHDTFQRDSILALQSAVSEMITAAYAEMDRMLAYLRESGEWSARQWETPTAIGWSAAVLRLEQSRARVFDDELRSLADELRTIAGEAVWAADLESAQRLDRQLEPLQHRFNEAVTRVLPALY